MSSPLIDWLDRPTQLLREESTFKMNRMEDTSPCAEIPNLCGTHSPCICESPSVCTHACCHMEDPLQAVDEEEKDLILFIHLSPFQKSQP